MTVQVWYRVGSRNERPGTTGISHFLEHMMFKGTPKYGPGLYTQLIQRYGGTQNAFTSYDMTAYYSVLPSARLELALTSRPTGWRICCSIQMRSRLSARW